MFTGIISDKGRITARSQNALEDVRFRVQTAHDLNSTLGASVACSGICLTIVAFDTKWFEIEASAETLSRTTAQDWQIGSEINLERPLRAGDEVGGHLVSGHIDGIAILEKSIRNGGSTHWQLSLPAPYHRFVAAKGSIALDGVSLTVNEVTGQKFTVNIIAHTMITTNFGARHNGDGLNFEIDVLARYLARWQDTA